MLDGEYSAIGQMNIKRLERPGTVHFL